MLNQATINKMHELKLFGMLQAWEQVLNKNEHSTLPFIEGLGIMIDHESNYRQNKKQLRLLKSAKLRLPEACIENIKYESKRNLSQVQIQGLLSNQWLKDNIPIILTGPTGVGKTYLACALAQHACRCGISASYHRLPILLEQLRIAHADGSYLKFLGQLQKSQCLIIDDWGIEPIPLERRNDLLEIIDSRYKRSSMIITSQLPIELWHDYIGEPMIADAILDRLVHKAIQIKIEGDSMRKAD